MLKKSYTRTGRSCRVTFTLPTESNAQDVALCGEFNNWDSTVDPMKRRKDGRFSLTISLKSGRQYRFKYLLDGQRWENDREADGFVPNEFGSKDSVITV